MKNVLLVLALLIAGCATSDPPSSYSLQRVAEAAGEALEKAHAFKEFQLYNIPPGKRADPAVILRFLQAAKSAGQAAAIGSEKTSDILEVLRSALAIPGADTLDGLVLIIVAADRIEFGFNMIEDILVRSLAKGAVEKRANKSPEPTPTAVTPRATESRAK